MYIVLKTKKISVKVTNIYINKCIDSIPLDRKRKIILWIDPYLEPCQIGYEDICIGLQKCFGHENADRRQDTKSVILNQRFYP